MDDYVPKDCKFYASVEDGLVQGHMSNGHINFSKNIRRIIESYIRIGNNCKDCSKYYFCEHEDKKKIKEKELIEIYKLVVEKFGFDKIRSLFFCMKYRDNNLILENFLVSGLYAYIEIEQAINKKEYILDQKMDLELLRKIKFELIKLFYKE